MTNRKAVCNTRITSSITQTTTDFLLNLPDHFLECNLKSKTSSIKFVIHSNFVWHNVWLRTAYWWRETFCLFEGSFTFPINYIRAMTRTRRIIAADDQIRCRTLLLWGDADQFLDTGLIPLAAQYVPKLDVEIIRGASHWVQMDQPEAVNSRIRDFLDRQ